MMILNLGCGTKVSERSEVINIDWSIALRIKKNFIARQFAPIIFKGRRYEQFCSLSKNIRVHNLARGIPFDTNSIDVVYHSHMLEHLDREISRKFLLEVKRVLKPNGIHRIVVPDFEYVCQSYISHVELCSIDSNEIKKHDSYIAAILEQSVRKEAYGTSRQKSFRRFAENILLGDARRRGETHQWMYDCISLKEMLLDLGYRDIQRRKYNESLISNWNEYGIDLDVNGFEYKPGSLYMEAVK